MKANELEGEVPAKKLAQIRKIGFYLLLLDYVFISYLIFRVLSITYIFNFELEGIYIRYARFAYLYAHAIPTLETPSLFTVLFLYKPAMYDTFRKKAMVKKDAWKFTFRRFVVPTVILFIFSGLFIDTLNQYISYLPDDIQYKAVPAYYFSYFIMIVYFLVRTFFTFDYYQAFYLKDKSDYRALFGISLIIFLAFTLHKLPYMIFL